MIVVVYGTRPEFIKLFPVIRRLKQESVPHFVISTGQHGEVLRELEGDFHALPDLSLDVLSLGMTGADLFSRMVTDISRAVRDLKPTMLVSQGDTFTVLATSMVAFLKAIPHAHVEAGLRSFDLQKPFPEEFNRRVTTLASTLHFAPTRLSLKNLLAEGVPRQNVYMVGNTIVDMVEHVCRERSINTQRRRLVYITTHRRENWGEPIRSIVQAVKSLCLAYGDHEFVWSLHPNPALKADILDSLGDVPDNLSLRQAIGYIENLEMIASSALILSDSGGIQEEAACLGKDILVLREVTERPEVVEAGYAVLCGHDPTLIKKHFGRLVGGLEGPKRSNPFGDGAASGRIVDEIRRYPMVAG
jgi:UDP-N-acetylglucosamine 2-epimerase (non-hydrolysing)